jgi:hypothetical protein
VASQQLLHLERVKQEIAACRGIKEAKRKIDEMQLLSEYAKKIHASWETQNDIAEAKVRWERQAGKLLGALIRHQGGRPSKKLSQDVTVYEQIGIDKVTGHRWQTEFCLPDSDFEDYVQEVRIAERSRNDAKKKARAEITSHAVYVLGQKLARGSRKKKEKVPGYRHLRL